MREGEKLSAESPHAEQADDSITVVGRLVPTHSAYRLPMSMQFAHIQ